MALAEFKFDIISFITALGIFHGFFLAFLVLKIRGGNHTANRVLSVFLINYSISILFAITVPSGFYRAYPELMFHSRPFQFCIGPLLYLYVRVLTDPSAKPARKDIFHFIPAAIAVTYYIPLFFESPVHKIEIIANDDYGAGNYIFWYASQIQIWAYLLISLRLIRKHEKRIREMFSSIDNINLSWLKFIISGIFAISFFFLALAVTDYVSSHNNPYINLTLDRISPLLIALFIWVMGYKGLLQPRIFTAKTAYVHDGDEQTAGKVTTPLRKAEEIIKDLTSLMNEKKPFLDPELTLPSLADMLNVPRNALSMAINIHENRNFLRLCEFIPH